MSSKRTQPNEGELIEVNWRPVFSTQEGFNAQDAIVQAVLGVQFTAIVQVDGEPLAYYFFHDQGDTWRFKDAC